MSASERRYVFLGLYRLDELYGHAMSRAEGARKRISGFSFQAFGTGGGVDVLPVDKRIQLYREIDYLVDYLTKSGRLGSFDDPRRYFHGRLSMYFVPFHNVRPPTLYMVGETDLTFVALAGQVADICHRDADYAKAEDGAPYVRDEPEVIRAIARANLEKGRSAMDEPATGQYERLGWEADIVETHRRFGYYQQSFLKKEYQVLAFQELFTPRGEATDWMPKPTKGVLLGKPLFVAEVFDD